MNCLQQIQVHFQCRSTVIDFFCDRIISGSNLYNKKTINKKFLHLKKLSYKF
jgi:hypothetical protein